MNNDTQIIPASNFIAPVANIQEARARYQAVKDFISGVLVDGVDFGVIPGTDKKVLLKAGAEKMTSFFGFSVRFSLEDHTEDWTGADHAGEPFFNYRYKCQLWRGDVLIAEGEGSCNSWETKFRYRWVDGSNIPAGYDPAKLQQRGGRISELTFAVEKAETSGQYGKPAEYWRRFTDAIANGTAKVISKKVKSGAVYDAWEIDSTLYRVPNADPAEQVNTYQKMAQKRALVAPVLIATNTSDYFTQDLDDYIDAETQPVTEKPATNATSTQPATPSPTDGEPTFKANSNDAIAVFAEATGLAQTEAAKTLTAKFKGGRIVITHSQIIAYAKEWAGIEP